MLSNPVELAMLVDTYEADREEQRHARRLLAQVDRDAAGSMARLRRTAGLRLIVLGERLAGRRDGHFAGSGAPLQPAGWTSGSGAAS